MRRSRQTFDPVPGFTVLEYGGALVALPLLGYAIAMLIASLLAGA